MFGFLARTLTGSTAAGAFGPWLLLAAVAAIGTGGYVARGVVDAPKIANLKTDYANCRAAKQKDRADGAETVIGALENSAANVTSAMNSLASKADARARRADAFKRELANVPVTHVCGASPAELVYRRAASGGDAGGVRPKAVP